MIVSRTKVIIAFVVFGGEGDTSHKPSLGPPVEPLVASSLEPWMLLLRFFIFWFGGQGRFFEGFMQSSLFSLPAWNKVSPIGLFSRNVRIFSIFLISDGIVILVMLEVFVFWVGRRGFKNMPFLVRR
jgi:hypothetical protein